MIVAVWSSNVLAKSGNVGVSVSVSDPPSADTTVQNSSEPKNSQILMSPEVSFDEACDDNTRRTEKESFLSIPKIRKQVANAHVKKEE